MHWIAFLLVFGPGGLAVGGPVVQPWFPKAPPLEKPAGEVIRVGTVAELFQAVRDVKPGGSVLLTDGHYQLPRRLELHTDRITLRGESGRRDKVILDGGGWLGELVAITRSSGVTIADLTIQNVKWNGFKVNSDQRVNHLTIYNCVIHNVWQRGVKGVAVPDRDREESRPYDCRIEYCLFYNDRPKQFSDDEADPQNGFGGNYVGGIDVMSATRWTIRDNVFTGIHGRTGEARGAIFLWVDGRDCLIERNIIIDCDCGICLGNSHRGPETKVHCTNCTVRNNFVTRCPENAILADYTRDCKILHNTIHDPGSRLQRLIRLVHDDDRLVVANNLLSGPPIRIESESRMRIEGNLSRDFTQGLVDPAAGNLHLRPDAVRSLGKVKRLAEAPEDIDRHQRHEFTVVGADEGDR